MNDYYDAKYLRAAITKITPARLFFRNRFFTESMTFPTKTVTFEYAKNTRALLPFSDDHMPSPPVKRNPYQALTFTAPLLSGSRTITADTLAQKLIGESPYNSGMSMDERAEELALRDLMELTDALYKQEEYMCARLKQDGKFTVNATGLNTTIDYGFTQIETVASANKWGATSDVLGYLTKKARELRKNGINPDMLIVGHDASEALCNNEGVLKLRHDQFVDIPAPASLEDGVTFVCRLRAPGLYLNVYEYDEYYEDEDGDLQPMIDPKTAILQSSREHNMMLHGAVLHIDTRTGGYVSEMREYVPYVVTHEDPPVRKLIVSSRTLPMPTDITSWITLKNVI
ncbi:MAG: major capsid protein [Synergistaceae bacterium]|nr:major capsid protein [Synergistaceae bacterium]